MATLSPSIQTSVPLVRLDRLSSLPDDIIQIIFMLMPIRDVVRTSALARIWRYKWMSIPGQHGRCRVEDALGGSVNAREVYLLKHFIEKLFICSTPDRFCITFLHLSHISLEINFEDSKEMLAPLFLFRSAPCLEDMTITNYSNAQNSIDKELLSSEAVTLQAHLHENEVVIPKLKTMKLFGFRGMDHEMKLIKFMLWNGVALERIIVTWDVSIFEEIDRRLVIVQGTLLFTRLWGTRVIFQKPMELPC